MRDWIPAFAGMTKNQNATYSRKNLNFAYISLYLKNNECFGGDIDVHGRLFMKHGSVKLFLFFALFLTAISPTFAADKKATTEILKINKTKPKAPSGLRIREEIICTFWHLILGPSLTDLQSQNPRNSGAIPSGFAHSDRPNLTPI